VINPSPEFLIDLVLKAGDEYWAAGSGDAGLNFVDAGETFAEMILIVREAYGVFVHHVYSGERGGPYALEDQEAYSGEVTITHAGQPWTLPRAFFVEKDKAIIAIRQFLKDGTRSPNLHWSEF
jgi:hypothetical protein